MKFTITLEFHASNEEKAMQTAEVLQRLLQDVPEEKIGELHKLLKERRLNIMTKSFEFKL